MAEHQKWCFGWQYHVIYKSFTTISLLICPFDRFIYSEPKSSKKLVKMLRI
jgi:hypothetical protein